MILKLTLAILFIFSLSACTQQQRPRPKEPEVVSEALQGKSNSSALSKRSGGNVVVPMYDEIVAKSPELQQLEKQVGDVRNMAIDSTAGYNDYDSKSQNYYRTAKSMSNQLHDSIIRKTLVAAIESSLGRYNQKVANHTLLQNQIAAKNLTVSDLYVVLQVVRTLPVIEEYQQKNLPSTRPMHETNRQLDEVIRKLAAAAQKNQE